MSTFEEIKAQYVALRHKEKKGIINYLKSNGGNILNERGGIGRKNYTSGNKLKTHYDLSNWKWIVVEIDGKELFISLQAFDKDKNSGNFHVLMDRIGIHRCKSEKCKKENFLEMNITEIELPMNNEKLDLLLNLLKSY